MKRGYMLMKDVKITVLEKIEVGQIHREYAKEGLPLLCSRNEKGDEYVSVGGQMPEGFCPGAWKSLEPKVLMLASGESSPYVNVPGVSINSCADGLHPVIFKLEWIR